jgi:hypothetical protein
MQYLAVSEYEDYGLEAVTPEALVASASTLIDSLCRRPSLAVTEYCERVRVAPESGRARLTYLPLCVATPASSPITKCRVRYAGIDSQLAPDFTRDIAQAFGLAGSWIDVEPSQLECVIPTGEIVFPVQILSMRYVEAEVTYTAGFDVTPDAVKFACAQLVRNAQASPALNVKRSGLDRMQMEYFGPTLTDETVKRLLAPYVAVRCGA